MEHIAPLLTSFSIVTRFTALISDRDNRIAVSNIVADAPHNGSYGFLAASDEVQKLTDNKMQTSDKLHMYTVRDALKRIHEHLNLSPVEGDYADTHEEDPE